MQARCVALILEEWLTYYNKMASARAGISVLLLVLPLKRGI